MGPRDRPRALHDGAACTACGATVPGERIRVLAQRDDVAFVELECPACDSTTLALLIDPLGADGATTLDVDQDAGGGRMTMGRRVGRPISDADVEALRRDLANWEGDLVGWLEALDRGDRRGTVLDR